MDTAVQSFGDLAVQRGVMATLANSKASTANAKLEKAANDFVAMFYGQMLQPMFEGLEVDSMFGGGHGEEVMRGFLIQEYGKSMAANDRSGLSDAIKADMLKLQQKKTQATMVEGAA